MLRFVISALVPPLCAVGLVLAVAAPHGRPARSWASPVALGSGYLLGQFLVIGWPHVPPFLNMESTHWIAYLAAGAMLVGLLETSARVPRGAVWAARIVLVSLAVGLQLSALWDPTREERLGWGELALVGLLVLAFWANLGALAQRIPGRGLTIALACEAAGAAVVLERSGSLVQALLAAVLMVELGAVLGAQSLWNRAIALRLGGAAVIAVVLAMLGLDGHYFSNVPLGSALALGIAPAGLWLGQIGPLRRLGRWPAPVAAALGFVVLLAVAIGLALAAAPRFDPNEF